MYYGYVVGRPVSGSAFYGRRTLLDRVYKGPEWGTWLVGGRRMGKTSFLHQIRYYTLCDPQTLGIFCDWQPARNMDQLKDILLAGMQDPEDQVMAQLDMSEGILGDLHFNEVLRTVVERALEKNMRVFLLIDEPEDALFELATGDSASLKQLRVSLLQGKALHTVITSGPRLRALRRLPWETSHFWDGFDQLYIGPLEWDEAVELVCQGQAQHPLSGSDEVIRSILEGTGRIPWLIQSVCRELALISELSNLPDHIWKTHEHDDRFETDYRRLPESARCVLRSIGGSHEPVKKDDTAQTCRLSVAQVSKIANLLEQLGYLLRCSPDEYRISNRFLREWLVQGLWQECEDEIERRISEGVVGDAHYKATGWYPTPATVVNSLPGTTMRPEQSPYVPEITRERADKPATGPQPGILSIDPDKPSIAAIRELLLSAFTPEDLRRFCRDRPLFRPIVTEFGPGQGLDDMVDQVIDYCGTRLLWREFLTEVAKDNPRQYTRFEPFLRGTDPDLP